MFRNSCDPTERFCCCIVVQVHSGLELATSYLGDIGLNHLAIISTAGQRKIRKASVLQTQTKHKTHIW